MDSFPAGGRRGLRSLRGLKSDAQAERNLVSDISKEELKEMRANAAKLREAAKVHFFGIEVTIIRFRNPTRNLMSHLSFLLYVVVTDCSSML